MGLLHPLLSSRECSSRHHSLSRKTNEQNDTSRENIKGWGQRVNSRGLKSMKCILKNPEASVDFHVTSHSGDEECVRSKPMVVT